ncbi:MAG: hypothetical protein LBT51_03130 [Fusobacteriaceae bacterium]|jgi:hypothetical protein|nr:hypothetical protein [Fusobacteriaceae bacterium]
MKEKWTIWNPKENLSGKYYIDSVDDFDVNPIIKLSNGINNKKLIIKWNGIINSYMYSKSNINKKLSESFDLTKWTFFKTEYSEYIEWVKVQSWHLYEDGHFYHYAIVGSNAVVDIIIVTNNTTPSDPVILEE